MLKLGRFWLFSISSLRISHRWATLHSLATLAMILGSIPSKPFLASLLGLFRVPLVGVAVPCGAKKNRGNLM